MDDDTAQNLSDQVEALVLNGMSRVPEPVLAKLDELVPHWERQSDPEPLLLALHGRTIVLARTDASDTDLVAACERLELTAQERRRPLWVAVACATRARIRLDTGEIGAAMGDLGRVDLDRLDQECGLAQRAGRRLLDILAAIYSRLRIFDRLDDVRERLEAVLQDGPVLERAWHLATWSGELAARAMEPLAAGSGEPDARLLDRAVMIARRASNLPPDQVPSALRRALDGVAALEAGYRGSPARALRLLGQDAFGDAADMPRTQRRLVRLAAMRSHALMGSLGTARGLDRTTDRTGPVPRVVPIADLVLEICQARERLWLETRANGDTAEALGRLNDLLSRLGWQGMTLVADTARQALEHQALRVESRTDSLTGVGNRRALDEELRHMLRSGRLPVAMVLLDIDGFKQINDSHTHLVGDEVLRRTATTLTGQMRVGDRLARYGGDEFVLLLPATGDQEARAVAARLESRIAGMPWHQLNEGLRVSVTTGCAALWSLSGRRCDKDAEYLFRRADEALLRAKNHDPSRNGTRGAGVRGPVDVARNNVPNGHRAPAEIPSAGAHPELPEPPGRPEPPVLATGTALSGGTPLPGGTALPAGTDERLSAARAALAARTALTGGTPNGTDPSAAAQRRPRRQGRRCADTPLDAPSSSRDPRTEMHAGLPRSPDMSRGPDLSGDSDRSRNSGAVRGYGSSGGNPMISGLPSNGDLSRSAPDRPGPDRPSLEHPSLDRSGPDRSPPNRPPRDRSMMDPSPLDQVAPHRSAEALRPSPADRSVDAIDDLGHIPPNPSLARRRKIRFETDGWDGTASSVSPSPATSPPQYTYPHALSVYDSQAPGPVSSGSTAPGRRPRARRAPPASDAAYNGETGRTPFG